MFETLKDAAAKAAAIVLLLSLFPLVLASSSPVEGGEWLEPGETELTAKAVLTTTQREGKEVTILDYSPETMANLEKLVHQRTRKLVVYYCGNLNRQLERFAKEHGPFVCQQGKGGKEKGAPPVSAFEVGKAAIDILQARGGEAITSALDACKGVKSAKEMHKEHAPLFMLVCVNQYLSDNNETATIDALPVPVIAALEDLKGIMDCPQEMVRLARRQLEIEYQHDGLKQIVASAGGPLDATKAQEFMDQHPVPNRAQFRLMEKQEKLQRQQKEAATAAEGIDKQEL